MEYRVMPFIGQVKEKRAAEETAQQLQWVINEQAANGWEFVQLTDVNIEIQPGCLAGLLGAQASYMRFDQIVFRREGPGSQATEAVAAVRAVAPAHAAPSAEVAGPKGQCPNCGSVVPLAVQECPKCKADFGPHSAWKVKPL